MRTLYVLALAVALMLGVPAAAKTAVPPGYPQSYANDIVAAHKEGRLKIWSVTDSKRVAPLLAGFRRLYPGIALEYVELPAHDLYHRFVQEADSGKRTADLLWSSAMDLQIKLVNDGYSQPYVSPERPNLPGWAVWKNEAWGITAEPIVFGYNRNLTRRYRDLPRTHPGMVRFLNENARALHGKVATYDPAVSAVGYLYLAQDKYAFPNTWDLVRAMGRSGVKLYPTAEDILGRLGNGQLAVAYDLIGSYALDAQARNPNIMVVVPRDYTLVMSRIAMIPANARNPKAARLFLDYMLSPTGQRNLAAQHMTPVRTDYPLPQNLRLDMASARAIRVGPALLVHQDRLTRTKFLRDWSRALAGN